jgi:hypothetical protein
MVGVSPEDAEKAEQRMRQLLRRRRVLAHATVNAILLIEEHMIEPYVIEPPQGRRESGYFPQTLDDLFLPVSPEEASHFASGLPVSRSDPNMSSTWEVPPTPAGSPRWLARESSALLDMLHERMNLSMGGLPSLASDMPPTALTFERLNRLVLSKSQGSAMVLLNLPTPWALQEPDCLVYVAFCECLSQGLARVLFVHSAQDGITQFF